MILLPRTPRLVHVCVQMRMWKRMQMWMWCRCRSAVATCTCMRTPRLLRGARLRHPRSVPLPGLQRHRGRARVGVGVRVEARARVRVRSLPRLQCELQVLLARAQPLGVPEACGHTCPRRGPTV